MKCIYINRKKTIITNILVYLGIFALLSNSQICIKSISEATILFINKLLPSLFPYLLITELLMGLNIAENLSLGFTKVICWLFKVPPHAASTIIISYFLGYPNAAKQILQLYEQQKINLAACKKLVSFTNNANPAYIIGCIGISMFNNIYIGIILLISHIISSIIIGLCSTSNNFIIQQKNLNSTNFKQISFSFEILLKALLNSVKTLVIIWGFTVIFSLIPNLLLSKLHLPYYIHCFLIGLCEISSGVNMIIKSNISITVRLTIVSFILSFSSLMVIFQIYSYIYKLGIKISYLIKYKLLHGLLSSLLTYIIFKFMFKNFDAISVFSSSTHYISTSRNPLIYFVIAFTTAFLLISTIKKKR